MSAPAVYGTYTDDDYPGYRVVIEYDEYPENPIEDSDNYLSCFPNHNAITLWNVSRNHTLPTAHEWRDAADMEPDELAENLPNDGTVIGLEYSGGEYLAVSDSRYPSTWDGYFHITEAHWRALMGSTGPEATTYTARETFLRGVLASECAGVTGWMQGDVFGYRVEHIEGWTNRKGETKDEWETIDSCCGYFGTGEIPYMLEEAWWSVRADVKAEREAKVAA